MARQKSADTSIEESSEETTVRRDSFPAVPFTESFSTWVETKLSYPREVFKGDYYRITGGQEEHYKLLREGWVNERAEDHPYTPWTASPQALEVARKGIERLNAEKQAALATQTPQVTKDHVAQMIQDALAGKLDKDS